METRKLRKLALNANCFQKISEIKILRSQVIVNCDLIISQNISDFERYFSLA